MMDFSRADLVPILGSSMPCRFADMPPQDFELFVAQFFRDSGFVVEQVKHGSDYGIDVIIAKGGKRTAVQVKRYAEGNKVGVPDVNQAVGGRMFYACDNVIFITTSDFTQPARRLAEETGVELWNWTEFQRRLSVVYLRGKSYQEYFSTAVSANQTAKQIAVRVLRWKKSQMKGNYIGALFYLSLSNRTDTNLQTQILRSTYITKDNNQYTMRNYLEGYFVSGVIYARCTVEACVVFDLQQLNRVRSADNLILDLLVDGVEQSILLQVKKTAPARSGCLIATAAFGTQMAEDVIMLIRWRDLYLRKCGVGRLSLALYYYFSPPVARWVQGRPRARWIVRKALRPVIWAVGHWMDGAAVQKPVQMDTANTTAPVNARVRRTR